MERPQNGQSGIVREGKGRRRPNWYVALAVFLVHLGGGLLLVRAFSPGFGDNAMRMAENSLTTFEVEAQPKPTPKIEPQRIEPVKAIRRDEGEGAPPGKLARPRPESAPSPRVTLTERRAPPTVADGSENDAGASEEGEGTGASGAGQGTGAGSRGIGTGGGGSASPTVKIAGDINSARDYPRAGRQARLGHSVIIDLSVNEEGKVSACRVHRSSPDPDADRITCRLATERFRFRPATDASGQAVPAIYRWQQRWFCC